MKVGIVGLGFIAYSHAEAVIENGHELVKVVGHRMEPTRKFAEKYNVGEYSTDISILYDGVDVVHVCTPPTLHYKDVLGLLLKGKHVLCEKPFTITVEEGEELAQIAKEKKLHNAVAFHNRYFLGNKLAKLAVETGNNSPLFFHMKYLQSFHILPTEYTWRYNEELAGKMRAVTEIGSHKLDLIQYVTGEDIVEVSSIFGRYNQKRQLLEGVMYEGDGDLTVNSEDSALISMKLSNGAIGSLILSEVTHGHFNTMEYEITMSDKTIRWSNCNPSSLSVSKLNDTSFSGENDIPENIFVDIVREFYNDIENGTKVGCYADFAEANKITKLYNAIYESDQRGGAWIKIK